MEPAAALVPVDPVADRLLYHRGALLRLQRCAHCAERLTPRLALVGGHCPRCGSDLHDGNALGEHVLDELTAGWARWRWVALGLLVLGIAASSLLPMAPALVTPLAMVLARVFVVRRPLGWVSPLRRVSAQLLLNGLMATLTVTNLLVNVFALAFPLVSAPVVAIVGVLFAMVYIEAALRLVRNRVRREAAGPGLDFWEWAMPIAVFGALAIVFLAVATVAVSTAAIVQMEPPDAAELTRFLLPWIGG